jgi:UDP-N-acetylmuramoyl-tripeptide--D-alanyl-D-alanine ligase
MPVFDADTLAAWTGGRWTHAPAAPLTGFTMDTRNLLPGEGFVALRTERRDGHDFLPAAEKAGAGGAIVSALCAGSSLPQLVVPDPLAALQAIARGQRRLFRGPVIAISGSAGKTSTKELLALLLGGAEPGSGTGGGEPPVLATRHNLNNHLGVPLTLTRLDPALHRFAVVEAGISAPGEMAELAAMIEPDLAIITLVAPAHLEGLGGIEGVAREKAVLAAAVGPKGLAVFPDSCLAFAPFRDLRVATRAVSPERIEHRDGTTAITLGAGERAFEFAAMTGGMARNAALALTAAQVLGVPDEELRARARFWRPAPLRGEWRRREGHLYYLDCYNANPASMADALAAFLAAAPSAEPRLFVLGGMEELGGESERHHLALGRGLRLRPGDLLCAVGIWAEAMRAGALEAGAAPEQAIAVASAEEAAALAAGFRGAVFVKGSRRYALERVAGEELHHA